MVMDHLSSRANREFLEALLKGNQRAGLGAEVFVERKFAGARHHARKIEERAGDRARSAGNV